MEDQKISPAVPQSSNSTSLVKASVMASSSTQPVGATKKLTLKPVMTLEGHEPVKDMFSMQRRHISFISYFPDGKGMVSASYDETTRQWDLRTGKEIEKVRDVCEQQPREVALSRDGQWVVTSITTVGNIGKLQARNVETRIVKTFEGHFNWIHRIDVSADSMLLVGGSWDSVRIWSMETGKLVADPFRVQVGRSVARFGVVRFSQDSKKLAILSGTGRCLEVWDVQTQKLDVRKEESHNGTVTSTPMFWTTKDKSIVAVFDFKDREHSESELFQPPPDLNTIYEFDALTLEIVGAPFKGHTHFIGSLALSFDCALLASASWHDNTIKLWAFESRQLLASFDNRSMIDLLIFSPNSHQLAYTNWGDTNIYIYDLPHDVLSGIWPAQEAQPKITKNTDLLNSDATPRAVRRKPVIVPAIPHVPRPLTPAPTTHPHHPAFFRYLRKLLPSSGTSAVPPVRNDQTRDPWDFPATSPIPPRRSPSAQASTQGLPHTISHENPRHTAAPPSTLSPVIASKARLSRLFTRAGDASPPIVDVPHAPAKLRYATAGAPTNVDDDLIRDEDYHSPPPSLNSNSRPLATGQNNRQRGKGLLCGCF